MSKTRRHFPLTRAVLMTAAFLLPQAMAQTAPATGALPSGGQVTAGQVSLATSGPAAAPTLTVTQGSDRAIVNWAAFDVGRDATVHFDQPSSSAAILNRVVGAAPSRIFGRLTANGQVFLVNPNGVYFSPTSSVDVGAFVASTLSIGDADFLAGRLDFRRLGATGTIVNEGAIRSALGGYVALLAPEVRNAGLIMAEAGSVLLAAGEAVSFNFDPAAGVTGLLVEPARVQALVDNGRIVRAPGGQVIVSAQAHNEMAAGVIRNTGEIAANGITTDGGRVMLGASDTVEQGGLVDASSATGKGGSVDITAPTIALLDASSLLATGELGGGRIHVGGGWQGAGPLPQARRVTQVANSLIDASAIRLGRGGEVVLWSDVRDILSLTQAVGIIRARGGELGGDGGRVETSGRVLDVGSLLVDTRSPLGRAGDWLLDPVNITIAASGGNLTPDQLRDGLLTSNVTISTAGAGSATGVSPTYSAGAGDITISSDVSSLSANSLTLVADNNIIVNAATSLGGALTLTAGGRVTFNAAVATTGGDIVVTAAGFAGTGAVAIADAGTLNVTQSGSSAFAGIIGGSGALAKAGAGALSLTGANTFTGGTTVTAGTIGVYHNTALGTGALTIGGATLRLGRGLAQVGNDIAFTGATTVVFDTAVDYLLVGGGGGGGAHVGGGGGGGGVLIGSTTLGGGTSAISVALGGTGSTNTDINTRIVATLGGNTTAFGLTAFGGGAGGNWTTFAATSGASGGGQGTNAAAIAGTQGFAGGMGDGNGNRGYLGGGGGGAGGVGGNAATDAGNGGIGLLSAIIGSDTYYGGGGGGGVHGIPPLAGPGGAGLGGQGGGGAGANYLVGVRAPGGLANTGGGGGGSGRPNNEISMGGNGGTGVVIVSYLGASAGTGGTVSAGTAGATGRTLHTFTNTGAGSLVLSAFNTVLSGAISGSGAVTLNATGGTLSLSGANTSTGTTLISGGTVRVGAGGATGALGAGAITNNAALVFNRTGTLTVSAAISGTGSVEQLGSGVTALSGAVSHTGGTTVTTGTLRVGAGGTTGTLAGNVVTQGVLGFDRSDEFTFAGAISGAGGVTQTGTGNLILTGAATFTGVTTVDAGGIIFRRDVPPTTSGFAGVGTATIESSTASFTSAFSPAYTYASTLTGLTLGKTGNATALTVSSAISIAGPIRIFGGDVTIAANVSTSGANQPIVFQAISNVLQNASRTIQTNGGDIVYWSNSTAQTTGNRGILISDSSTLDTRTAADRLAATHTTGGGMIVLGGGSATATSAKGTTIPTGYALNYTNVPAGLMVGSYNGGVGHNANVRMFSGGGDVVWRGRSTQNIANLTIGISAFEGVVVNAGTTGDITLDGVAVGNTTAAGMDIHGYRTGVANSSYLTVDGDILFTGSGTGATNNVGTQLGSSAGFPIILAATGAGTVTIKGITSGTASDINLTDVQLLSGSGSVSVTVERAGGKFTQGGTASAKFGQTASSVVTSSSANILVQADVLDVTSTNGLAINTSGAVELTSFNATGFTATPGITRLDVGGSVASAATNIGSFTFGKTTNNSAVTLSAGSINARGPIRLYGTNLTIGIPLRTDAANAEILLQGAGFIQTAANLTTTGATSPIRLLAGGYVNLSVASTLTTSGSNVLVASNTDATGGGHIYASGNQTIVTSGGSVTFGGGDATGSGYAEGTSASLPEGIRFNAGLSINTSVKNAGVSVGGGDIIIRGRSFTSSNYAFGAFGFGVETTTVLDSGTGTIRIDGISRVSSGDAYNMGVRLVGDVTATSASTSATAIHITGAGGSAGSNFGGGQGVRLTGGGNLITTIGVGGGIKISGTPGSQAWAVVIEGGSILSASGPIELSGTAANSYVYLKNTPTLGFKAGTPVTSSTANILLSFFDADWGGSSNPIIATSGSFTFRPSGTIFNRQVATSWFNLPTTLSALTLGSATNTSNIFFNTATTVQGPVTAQGGWIDITHPITAAGDVLIDADTGAQLGLGFYYGVNQSAAISTTAASNGNITIIGRGGPYAGSYGIYLQSAANLTAGGTGSISVTGIGGANTGNSNFGVRLLSSLTTGAGDITVNGSGGGTGAAYDSDGLWVGGGSTIRTTTGSVLLVGAAGVGSGSDPLAFVNGSGAVNLGNAGQSGSITIRANALFFEPVVNVLGSGAFTVEPTSASFTSTVNAVKFTEAATLTGYTLGKSGNTAALTVAANLSVAGPISVFGGDVTLTGGLAASAAGDILVRGSGAVTIAATRALSATNGDVTVTAGRFVNNSGSAALSAGGTGKTWRVWSTNANPYHASTGDVTGGLAFDFRQYDATYGTSTVLGTGKGMLYTLAPTLAASFTSTPTKVYDRTDTANVTSAMVTATGGFVGGDTNATFTITGATYASRNVGNAQLISFSTAPSVVAQTSSATGSKPAYGYQISGLGSLTGDITPLALTLTGVTAVNKVYDRSVTAVVSGGSVTPISGDTVTVDASSAAGNFANRNVGTAKSVTVNGYVLGGADAGNYTIGQPTGLTADITPLALSVTGVTAANKVYDRSVSATLSGGAVTALSGDTVTLVTTGHTGAFADWNVGTSKTVTANGYALGGADAGNYAIVQPTGLSAHITTLSLAVTGVIAANKVYDRSVTATLSGGSISPISGDTVTLDDSSAAGVFANWNVGTAKAVIANGYALTGTDAGNYAIAQPTGVTANITALSLAVTGVTAANKVYDRTDTAILSGGAIAPISGDTVTLDTSSAAGVFVDRNVGTAKGVTVSGYVLGGAGAANYAIAEPTGVTADITARSLIISGLYPTKVYDRSLTASVSGGTVTPISGDSVSVDATGATGAFADWNVGTGKSVTYAGFALSGSSAGNYVAVQPTGVTGDITALSLVVTGATSANKTYDALLAATLSGGTIAPISGDTVNLVTSGRAGVFGDKNVGSGKSVTISGYTITGADAGNYALVQPTGVTADITALSLAVTGATAANKTYDQLRAAGISGGVISAISGDTVILDISGRAGDFADKNVGTGKSVTVIGYTISGSDAGNYALVQPSGVTADITALSLAVTGATAANKTYDALLTAAISGGSISVLSGDTVTLDISGREGDFADKNVGTGKSVTVSGYAITGTDAANYSLVQPSGVTADITALSLVVTGATAANKTYDQLRAAGISGGVISAISGDDVTLVTTNRAGLFGDKNVGSAKSVTVSGYAIIGTDAANYSLVQPSGVTANITALSLAVTGATAANKTYDQLLTAAISGGSISVISGDVVTLVTSGRAGVFADKNVGMGKAVTVSGYALSGVDAANYSLVQPIGRTADITALSLAVTGATAANKTYDALLAATISGGTIAPISGDTVTLVETNRAGVFGDKDVGTGKSVTVSGYTITGADAANYSLVQPTGVAADITVLSLAVTGATAANKTYDALLAAMISGGSIAPISGDTVTLVTSGRAGVFGDKNVGSGKSVTVSGYALSGTDAGNYSLVQLTGLTADITALSLAVTGATAANKTYDALLTAAISGGSISVISGDTVTLDISGRAGVFGDKNVGTTKTVTVSGYTISGADAANYSLVQPTGATANITALSLAVTGATAAYKVYDQLLIAAISGGSISIISGDAVTLDISGRAGVFADKNVGTGKSVTVSGYTITGADAANYSLVQPTGLTADITALSLAVTGATAANKTYDALLAATLSGGSIAPISGDTVTLVTSGRAGVFGDKNVGSGKSVTISGYTITGADAGNYALVQPTGVTADISALSLAVTGAASANKTYDQLLTAAISGGSIAPISGDTVTLDVSGRAGVFGDKNVGTGKTVTVSGYALTGADASNYSIVQPTGVTADITALSLAVTGATAANKTYDALLAATLSGGSISIISGDTVSLDISGSAGVFGDKNVGTGKTVTVSGYTISGADADNYSLVQPTGVVADIAALSLAVTGATAANKTYDALLAATISGGSIAPISSDTVTLVTSGRAGVFGDKNVGTGKAVTVSGFAITGTDAGNYALVQPTGVTADITVLTLNVTGATAANKTYDALLTAAISGGAISIFSGDLVTLDISGRAGVFADKNAGLTKTVTISGYAISGADAANYSLVQPTGLTADITALSLAVTSATAANKTYDRTLTAAVSGGSISLISGDVVTLDISGRAGVFVDKNVGLAKSVTVSGYTISGADASNYSLVQPAGVTADITALSLAVTGAAAANKTYDQLLSAAISGGLISAISGDTVNLVTSGRAGVFADKNVGTGKSVTVSGYTITGTDAANYSLVQPTGLTADITALSLAVTGATAANKTYDALLGATISGGAISILSGDTVTLVSSGRAGVFGDKNVGTGKSVTVSGYTITGTDAGNYSLVQPTGMTADITALSLAVTGATAANKTYDALLTATLSGGSIAPIAGDTVTLVTSGRAGVFGDKNVGTGKSVTVSGYTITGTDAANYSLVQPTGLTADITALSLAVTGATAANKTYDALLGATISGGVISIIAGDTVVLDDTNRAGVFADKNVGTGKSVTVSGYTLTGTDAANYSLVQPTGLTADITTLSLNVTGATAGNKTYDALLTAAISGGAISILSGDIVILDISARAGSFADKNVGTAKSVTVSGYTISGADAANYSLVQPTGMTADITARSLAVTGATAANKTYDAQLASIISGGAINIIAGDSVTLDDTNRAGLFADKNVGIAKGVTVSGYALTGTDAANYALVQPVGLTADITALSLAVTGAAAANKTYDAQLAAAISGGAISAISGDDVTLVTAGRAGLFDDKNVGTGKNVTVSGYTHTGTDAANYSLVQPTGVTAEITQLTLNLTGVTAADKVYDQGVGATLAGGTIAPISGDAVSLVTAGRSGSFADKNVGTGKSVTVSGYAIAGADAGNYALAQPTGVTASITQLTLNLTGVTAADKVYDQGVAAALSGGTIAPISGDAVTLDISGRSGVFADKNVGTAKSVTVSGYALTGADATNYSLVHPVGLTADISVLSLAVTGATAASKTYDQLRTADISGGVISAISGDDVTLVTVGRAGLFGDKNVGAAKSVTVTGFTISGADAANYALVQPTGVTADITARSLAVTGATAASKVYDRLVIATISGGVISVISGDDVALDLAGRSGVFADWNVGTGKSVTASGYAITGADAANYSLNQPTGLTADITALSLAVIGVNAADKTYDRSRVATISGGTISVIGGDNVILDGTNSAGLFADKNVGTGKSVTVSGYTISGAAAANYSLVQPAGVTADITALSLAVTGVTASDKVYDRGRSAVLFGGAIAPLGGDIVILDASAAAGLFADKNVGVAKAVTATGFALTGADALNYAIVQPTGMTANIAARSLAVTGVQVANKTNDGNVTATLSGGTVAAISGDAVTLDVSFAVGAFLDSTPGTGKPVTASGYALTGLDSTNYSILQPTGLTGEITAVGGLLYPNVLATQVTAPTTSTSTSTSWVPAPTATAVSAPTAAGVQLNVSVMPISAGAADSLPIGQMFSITSAKSAALQKVSFEVVAGFVPGRTILEVNVPEGLEVSIDNTNGTITVTGRASSGDYENLLRGVKLRSADGYKVGPLKLKVGVTDETGSSQSGVVELRRGDVATAK